MEEEITLSRLSQAVLQTTSPNSSSNNYLMKLPLNIMISRRPTRTQAIKGATPNMEGRSALTIIIKAATKNLISRQTTSMGATKRITNISSILKAVNSSDRAATTCNMDR
jgi:hypothetical protein